MSMGQYFRTAIQNLCANKVRFMQVMLCMVVAVAGMIIALSMNRPLMKCIDFAFDAYDSPDTVLFSITTKMELGKRITIEDMRELAVKNPDIIEAVSPYIVASTPLALTWYDGKTTEENFVYGVDEKFLDTVHGLTLSQGRFFKPLEIDREQNVCVIGARVNGRVFHDQGLGKSLRIWGTDYKVIGVLYGSGAEFNLGVMLPYTKLKHLEGEKTRFDANGNELFIDTFFIKAKGEENIAGALIAATNMIEQSLGELGRDWHYNSASFKFLEKLNVESVYSDTGTHMLLAGLIMLLGGVGIMNIMLAVMQQRTLEIGIRKAFGATKRDIKRQFIVESLIISMLGACVGSAFGVIGTYVICYVMLIPFEYLNVPTIPILVAMFFSMSVGVIFGTYPAQQAAKLEIVEALNES